MTSAPIQTSFSTGVEAPTALDTKRWLVWLARLGVVLMAVAIILAIARLIPPATLVFPAIYNLSLSFAARRAIGERLQAAWLDHAAIDQYASLLRQIDAPSFTAPMLQRLTSELGSPEAPAHEEVDRLGSICNWAVPRSSLAHLPLQALASWDIHVLDALEGWQRKNGPHVREWLETIGTVEALSSLAQLTFDNPGWTFADFDATLTSFKATGLGHPLIPGKERVVNDVEVGPPGTILLITGSNMSGKSTLLRSIGINTVLAGAGAPSCARSLSLPPFELWTSVRVADSLEQGISFYMAELLRLREVHLAAEQAAETRRPFLYLLDEILQGTNSAERQIAARHVISQLVDLGAVGAVSTHDLGLADAGALQATAVPIHFTDGVRDGDNGPEMHFDYTIRPGIATSTNALELMKLVGFDLNHRDNGSIRRGERTSRAAPSRARPN